MLQEHIHRVKVSSVFLQSTFTSEWRLADVTGTSPQKTRLYVMLQEHIYRVKVSSVFL